MGYYSIVATAPQPIGILKPMVMLDTGLNVFTVQVDDLDKFLQSLLDEGVVLEKVISLEGVTEPNRPSDLLLPGEHHQLPGGHGEVGSEG